MEILCSALCHTSFGWQSDENLSSGFLDSQDSWPGGELGGAHVKDSKLWSQKWAAGLTVCSKGRKDPWKIKAWVLKPCDFSPSPQPNAPPLPSTHRSSTHITSSNIKFISSQIQRNYFSISLILISFPDPNHLCNHFSLADFNFRWYYFIILLIFLVYSIKTGKSICIALDKENILLVYIRTS